MNKQERQAERAEAKLLKIWVSRGWNPERIWRRDENGDFVLSDLAQDIFNNLYKG
jgi:hypothetical protein